MAIRLQYHLTLNKLQNIIFTENKEGVASVKEDILLDKFQYMVSDLLVRNKSILDGITKFQDSCARTNRAIVKSATHCGCCKILAQKQDIGSSGLQDLKFSLESHLEGTLCDECKEAIEKEMGKTLFYMASLCNTLDLNMYDILLKELDRVQLLGKYNLR